MAPPPLGGEGSRVYEDAVVHTRPELGAAPLGNLRYDIVQTLVAYVGGLVADVAATHGGGDPSAFVATLTARIAEARDALALHMDAATANVNTKTREIVSVNADQILADAKENFRALSAQISGGAGGASADVLAAAQQIAEVLIGLTDQLVAVLTHGPENLVDNVGAVSSSVRGARDAIKDDLVSVIRELTITLFNTQAGPVADEVRAGLEDVPASLSGLLESWRGFLESHLRKTPEAEGEITLAGVPNLKGLLRFLPFLYLAAPAADQAVKSVLGRSITEAILDQIPVLRDILPTLANQVGEMMVHGIEAAHGPLRSTMGGVSGLFFDSIDSELAGLGQSNPDTVLPMAKQLLTLAASLGATSHLIATAAEATHAGKHLGFPFVAAFLTDLAGFQDIARNSFGVQYEAALRSPARRRANTRFRPELPMSGDVVQMWYERRISDGDLRAYYQQQGWPDDWIDTQLQTLPIEASPRDLALVFEDGDVDEEWAVRHLVERGFTDDDAQRIAGGVRTKSLRTARQGAVTAVMTAYENGLVDAAGVVERLRPLRLSDGAIELYLLGSDVDRYRTERVQLRGELLSQASAGVVDENDTRATMAAWGYDARAQQQAAQLVRMRLQKQTFTAAAAEDKAATRRAQTDEITAALEQYRRFALTDAQLAAALARQGVLPSEVQGLVDLARVRRQPVPRLAEVLTPEAQAQRALEEESDRVIALLKREQISEAIARTSLIGLGLDPAEADRRVRLAVAQIAKPPDKFTPRPIDDVVQEARRVKMAAAREEFRAGLITVDQLGARLLAAGIEPPVVAAVIDFEQSKRRADAERDRAAAEQKAAAALLKAEQDAAVSAFRSGRIDADGLLSNLLAIGLTPSMAEAIVASEVARQKPPKP